MAILLAGVFYYRAFGTLKPKQWRTLLALRVAAILLVVLLLFRPVYSYQEEFVEKPALIFLLDASSSMSIADDASGVTRFNQARGKLEKWCERLKRGFSPAADRVRGTGGAAGRPSRFAGPDAHGQGDFAFPGVVDGFESSLLRRKSRRSFCFPTASTTRPAIRWTRPARLGLVVHAVGVGASLRSNPSYRDIQVTGIDCPDRMMLNNVARVTGSIDGIGLGGRVIQVDLDEDGQQVAEAELTLDDREGSQPVTFEFRPAAQGPPYLHGSRLPGQPRRRSWRTISDRPWRRSSSRASACCISKARCGRSTAPWSIGSWPRIPTWSSAPWCRTRPNVFLKRTNMTDLRLAAIPTDQETINKFDVFILGDIDSSYLRPPQQEMFVKRVREGAGLIMLGGYHSLGTGRILGHAAGRRPAGDARQPRGRPGHRAVPADAHARRRDHPIFANIGGFFPTRQGEPKTAGLPPLDGCTRVEGARPGATVLATFVPESGPDARAGRAAVRPRPHRRLHRRHDAKMAAGPTGTRPGIALLAILGADGPLAGRPRGDG